MSTSGNDLPGSTLKEKKTFNLLKNICHGNQDI